MRAITNKGELRVLAPTGASAGGSSVVSGSAAQFNPLYLRDTTTGDYVTVTGKGADAAPQLDFGAHVSAPPAPFFDVLYLNDATTGKAVALTIIGGLGAEQNNFGIQTVFPPATSHYDMIFITNVDTGNLVPLGVMGAVGLEQLVLGVGVANIPMPCFLILFLFNRTTGKFSPVTLSGNEGAETLNYVGGELP